MARPQLLFLAHRIPYPPDKGDKIRSWNILRHLAETYDVHLGAFVDDPADMRHLDVLRDVCADVFCIPTTGGSCKLRALKSLPGEIPLSVAMLQDPRMRAYVDDKCDAGEAETIYLFSGQMAPYALRHASRRRLILMDFVDVDSDKFRQFANTARLPMKSIYLREAKRLHQFEKQVARAVDASLFVSQDEAALFRRTAGSYAHTVHALENGVDTDFFDPAPFRAEADPAPNIIFTGAMDYLPNVEAARWLAKEILPAVRKRVPGASLTIVGARPGRDVQRLAGAGIEVTGRVEDVRPYFGRAAVAAAPMKTARGVQNKVLEGMAMQLPVVTTPAGLSGIDAEPGRHLLVAEVTEGLAAQIAGLLEDRERARDIGEAARAHVVRRYGWAHQLSVLDSIIAELRPEAKAMAS